MNWEATINDVLPHVVKIETPSGHGTGFLAFYNHDKTWCGIATAAHVVGHADLWKQPIRVLTDNETRFLKEDERVIFTNHSNDAAIILFFKGDLQLPEVPIALAPMDEPGIGVDVGWLGFPNMEPNTKCFFAGTISAKVSTRKTYLIDGVAIHGVSGGPVFYRRESGENQIIGCVSQYHANRATGEALPGMLAAQDVSHFLGIAEHVKSVDEGNAQKKQLEEQQKKEAIAAATIVAADKPTAGTAPTELSAKTLGDILGNTLKEQGATKKTST